MTGCRSTRHQVPNTRSPPPPSASSVSGRCCPTDRSHVERTIDRMHPAPPRPRPSIATNKQEAKRSLTTLGLQKSARPSSVQTTGSSSRQAVQHRMQNTDPTQCMPPSVAKNIQGYYESGPAPTPHKSKKNIASQRYWCTSIHPCMRSPTTTTQIHADLEAN